MRVFIASVALLLIATPAFAGDAVGTNTFKKSPGGTKDCRDISEGGECFYQFSSAVNSAIVTVRSDWADVCFNDDTASTTANGNIVWIRRIVGMPAGDSTTEENSFIHENLKLSGPACWEIPRGKWYVDVNTYDTGTAVVAISARK